MPAQWRGQPDSSIAKTPIRERRTHLRFPLPESGSGFFERVFRLECVSGRDGVCGKSAAQQERLSREQWGICLLRYS